MVTDVLWISTSTDFCYYFKTYEEFEDNFKKRRPSNTQIVTLRYETAQGRQAQLDWKESLKFLVENGEWVVANIFGDEAKE